MPPAEQAKPAESVDDDDSDIDNQEESYDDGEEEISFMGTATSTSGLYFRILNAIVLVISVIIFFL